LTIARAEIRADTIITGFANVHDAIAALDSTPAIRGTSGAAITGLRNVNDPIATFARNSARGLGLPNGVQTPAIDGTIGPNATGEVFARFNRNVLAVVGGRRLAKMDLATASGEAFVRIVGGSKPPTSRRAIRTSGASVVAPNRHRRERTRGLVRQLRNGDLREDIAVVPTVDLTIDAQRAERIWTSVHGLVGARCRWNDRAAKANQLTVVVYGARGPSLGRDINVNTGRWWRVNCGAKATGPPALQRTVVCSDGAGVFQPDTEVIGPQVGRFKFDGNET
jgi:hypothetical protein